MCQLTKKLKHMKHGEQHLSEVAYDRVLWKEYPFINRTHEKQRLKNLLSQHVQKYPASHDNL